MQLHFHKAPYGNFGDDLNLWIWDALLPGWRDWAPDVVLIGVGTLLNEKILAPYRERRLLIIGSGVGYGQGPPTLPLSALWDFRSVRGPWSARVLGLPRELGITDPAIMLPDCPEFQGTQSSGLPIFIPHHQSIHRHDWVEACCEAGLTYVSPKGDARDVIHRIAAASLVVAESMHAAIIADAFRVPWIPLRFNPFFNAAKWQDWAESMELSFNIPHLTPLLDSLARSFALLPRGYRVQEKFRHGLERARLASALRRSAEREPYLSSNDVIQKNKRRYREVLEAVLLDYA